MAFWTSKILPHPNAKFMVGDRVRVVPHPPFKTRTCWDDDDDRVYHQYVPEGRIFTIEEINAGGILEGEHSHYFPVKGGTVGSDPMTFGICEMDLELAPMTRLEKALEAVAKYYESL